MKKWVKVPLPGQFRGEGVWRTIEDAGCPLEDWEVLRDTGYLPVHEGEEKPND